MNEFIDELVKQKEYSKELENTLRIILPAMVEYYGEEYEMLICEAISSCYICQCEKNENIYDVVKKYDNMISNENSVVNEGDLKRADGVNLSIPNITYKDGNHRIDSVTRIVALASYAKLDTDFGKSTLIHKLGHLIKSYKNEYTIEGDIITSRSGFIETKEKLSISEDGSIVRSTISEKNVGLEEGINAYDEACILSIINNTEKKFRSYQLESTIIENLINLTGLRKEILESQFIGDTSIFIDKYNEGSDRDLFSELASTMDDSVKATYEALSNIFLYGSDKEEDKLKVQEINDKRRNIANIAYNNILEHNNQVNKGTHL